MTSSKSGCNRAKWLYSAELVVIGQSGCVRAKVVLFGQNGCITAKVVVFGQGGCILAKWLYSG